MHRPPLRGGAPDAEQLAERLEAHPDYRVLRRLDVSPAGEGLAGPTVRRA